MKILLIMLICSILVESWKYSLKYTNEISFNTDAKAYNIKELSNLTQRCAHTDKSTLFEMPDRKSRTALNKFLRKFRTVSFALNMKRINEDAWFWSNDLPGDTTFDESEIIRRRGGVVPWYAYLQCSAKNIKCTYSAEYALKQKKSFICQYERKCKQNEQNSFERNDFNNKSPLCYKIFRRASTWSNARVKCLNSGGDLGVFRGLNLREVEVMVGVGGRWWVGVQKARWIWLHSGKEAKYTNWKGGDPNPVYYNVGIHAKKCAATIKDYWKSVSCVGYYGLVCMTPHSTIINPFVSKTSPTSPFDTTFPGQEVNSFYRVTLPILVTAIVFLILLSLFVFFIFYKIHRNKKEKSKTQKGGVEENNRDDRDDREIFSERNENNPTYSNNENIQEEGYFKVFNITGAEANAIKRQKALMPKNGYLNEAFKSDEQRVVKSVLFNEDVVFNPALSVVYNKVNKDNGENSNNNKNIHNFEHNGENRMISSGSEGSTNKEATKEHVYEQQIVNVIDKKYKNGSDSVRNKNGKVEEGLGNDKVVYNNVNDNLSNVNEHKNYSNKTTCNKKNNVNSDYQNVQNNDKNCERKDNDDVNVFYLRTNFNNMNDFEAINY